MPPKIRELISQLQSVGFKNRGGKGSHRNFTHKKGCKITVSGKADEQIRTVTAVIHFMDNQPIQNSRQDHSEVPIETDISKF